MKLPLPSWETVATFLNVLTVTTFTAVCFRTITFTAESVPTPLQTYLKKLATRLSFQLTVVIKQSDGLSPNHLYDAVNTYLSTKLSPSIHRIEAHKLEKDRLPSVYVDKNQDIHDSFQNGTVKVKLTWALRTVFIENHAGSKTKVKYFELVFYKKHKETVLNSYLPYILQRAKEIKEERKTVRLHTVDYDGTDYWRSVALTHLLTFETVAMETAEMEEDMIEDLDRFIGGGEYYRSVGKAWKRGYLLYGPPGTGKSSLVAAKRNRSMNLERTL